MRMSLASTVAALLLVPLCAPVRAQNGGNGDTHDEQTPAVWSPTSAHAVTLFPSSDPYPVYVADPHRPTSAIIQSFYPHPNIPDASSPRTFLAGGGHFGILRIGPAVGDGRSWQISLDAGFGAVFDSQNKNDGLGWDGNYGLTVTTASSASRAAFKVALLHRSAHLGDEYAERTGARRINYTREELAVAVGWRIRPRWRAYGEAGLAYVMRSDGQKPWRLQGGIEYEARPRLLGGRLACYAATDVSVLEERRWRLDPAVQAGVVTRTGGRAYRLFAEWYDGRGRLGQFSQFTEATFSTGFRVDL